MFVCLLRGVKCLYIVGGGMFVCVLGGVECLCVLRGVKCLCVLRERGKMFRPRNFSVFLLSCYFITLANSPACRPAGY